MTPRALVRRADCYVSTGGYIERVLATSGGSHSAVSRYLRTCKDMGFDVLELSAGFLSLPADDWTALIALTVEHGLKPKPEVGIQWGAGGDASVAELEGAGTRDVGWLVERAKTFLDAGAYVSASMRAFLVVSTEYCRDNVASTRR